jgi:hypothetical protein
MSNLIKGGFLRGHRTYIISGIGILSAIGGYLVGDTDVFMMAQSFLRWVVFSFCVNQMNPKGG